MIALRHRYPDLRRTYRVPFGTPGVWLATTVVMFWFGFGTVVAVAPGTLEGLLGIDYDFDEIWGLDQLASRHSLWAPSPSSRR